MTQPSPSSRSKTKPAAAFQFAGAGLQYSLTLLAFAFGGWWLDAKWGTSPWLLLSGVLLGFAGATYSLVARVGTGGKRKVDTDRDL